MKPFFSFDKGIEKEAIGCQGLKKLLSKYEIFRPESVISVKIKDGRKLLSSLLIVTLPNGRPLNVGLSPMGRLLYYLGNTDVRWHGAVRAQLNLMS